MQWRNGGKVPEVGKDSGRIDRSLRGRMWREKVNSWIVASSQFPRTAIIRLSLVYTLNTLLWLWTPAFSAVPHTLTHTHRGSVYACEPSVCSPRQLTGLRVRGFPLLGPSKHFLSELNSLQTGSLCRPLPSLFALYRLAEICYHNKNNSKGLLTLQMQMGGTVPADAVVYYPSYARTVVVCLVWRQNLF